MSHDLFNNLHVGKMLQHKDCASVRQKQYLSPHHFNPNYKRLLTMLTDTLFCRTLSHA